jgi:hypothetical protein
MFDINVLEIAALAVTLVLFGVLYYLGNKKNVDFGILTLLGTGFGILVGVIFKENYTYVAFFGNVYTRILSALVIPLLLFSIISSITSMGSSIRLKKVGLKSVLFLLLNTFTAATLTLIAAVALGIGKGFQYEAVTDYEASEVPSLVDTLLSLFPNNIISHWSNGEVVPIVTFALIIAVAYNTLTAHNEEVAPFKAFVDAGNKVLGQAVSWLMDFTPFAVLSLIARAVGRSSVADLLPLLGVLALAYVLCIVQAFGVEGILLKVIGKLNPVKFFKGIAQAQIVAFTSQSSVGTVPVTIRQLKKLGVDEDVASFTSGLGANLGMPGCAGMWPVLLAVFTVNAMNLNYGVFQYVFLIVLALIVSLGTVGVPGTATITATALMSAAGLPVEMIVIFAPISSIVDMARTATNVTGAATAAVLVAESEELLDRDAYNAENIDVIEESISEPAA